MVREEKVWSVRKQYHFGQEQSDSTSHDHFSMVPRRFEPCASTRIPSPTSETADPKTSRTTEEKSSSRREADPQGLAPWELGVNARLCRLQPLLGLKSVA